MDSPIQFTLNGLFAWIFGILVAIVGFFFYSTFKQNAEDKRSMMDEINKHSKVLNKLLTEHRIAFKKHFPDVDDGGNNDGI
jgi:hypothetical protein